MIINSSPFQVYQAYQKGKKGNNLINKSTQSLNIGKRVLFESNKEKDKKNKNNFQSNFFNLKGKEAQILQNLVYNLQSNIPEYEKNFINEEDIKNMKNKFEKNNNNI